MYKHDIKSLFKLGLAGNLITDYSELLKIRHLNVLQEISLNDIHFGKCPLVMETPRIHSAEANSNQASTSSINKHKDFIMCHLPNIMLIGTTI